MTVNEDSPFERSLAISRANFLEALGRGYYPATFINANIARGVLQECEKTIGGRSHIRISVDRLDVETAEELAKWRGGLSFDMLSTVSGDVAKVFAQSRASMLSFAGLPEIEEDIARTIAFFPGSLALSGLCELSVNSARALAEHRGGCISLGMPQIDDLVAEALSAYDGRLVLNRLQSVSNTSAGLLARKKGLLNFYALHGLSTKTPEACSLALRCLDLLRIDGTVRPQPATFDCIAELSADFARTMLHRVSRTVATSVVLDGLLSLSVDVAEVLVTSNLPLSLNGLSHISDKCARVLSACPVPLELNGLGYTAIARMYAPS